VPLRRCIQIHTSKAHISSCYSNTTCFGPTDCHHQVYRLQRKYLPRFHAATVGTATHSTTEKKTQHTNKIYTRPRTRTYNKNSHSKIVSEDIIGLNICCGLVVKSFRLQIQRSLVRFPALPDFRRNRGSGTGPSQPREDN
jgi:hypothetical protein